MNRPVTRVDVRDRVGFVHTDTAIDEALAGIDQGQLYSAERRRWRPSVWNRAAPINGAPAEPFLERPDVSDAPVYLAKRDGVVVAFQPHQRHQPGLRRITDPEVAAAAHCDDAATDRVRDGVLAAVEAALAG